MEKIIEILRIKYLENRFYYEGLVRKEDMIYPEDALREAVINALIHRDYLGPHTQLRVYGHKLWLVNAGTLPDKLTFEKLKKQHLSCPRNELLADVFFKAGYIEAWGRGTLKIINQCKEKGLPEPEFSELTGGFLVSFRKAESKTPEQQDELTGEKRAGGKLDVSTEKGLADGLVERLAEGLVENQRKIMDLMREKPQISKRDLSQALKISDTAIDKNIAQLKRKGLLKRVGPDKGGHWEVKK